MSWLLWGSSQKLTGPYPGGQKMFRCSFSMEQIEMESQTSKCQTSGDVSWTMQVTKVIDEKNEEKEELKVFLKCQLEDHVKPNVAEEWHVDVDHIIRLVNHEKSEKSLCTRGSDSFKKDKQDVLSATIKTKDITSDFLLNDELTFEVEIGVKNTEGLIKTADFSVKTENATSVFVVGKDKFYVNKEALSEKSDAFKKILKVEGEGKLKNEYKIDDVDPVIFHVFIKYLNDIPVQLELEQVEALWAMSERFSIREFKNKCKDFLMNSVVDDAVALKLADKFGMQDVIVEKLKPLNTISELKKAFRFYRRFSDESMRLLLKKLIQVA